MVTSSQAFQFDTNEPMIQLVFCRLFVDTLRQPSVLLGGCLSEDGCQIVS